MFLSIEEFARSTERRSIFAGMKDVPIRHRLEEFARSTELVQRRRDAVMRDVPTKL